MEAGPGAPAGTASPRVDSLTSHASRETVQSLSATAGDSTEALGKVPPTPDAAHAEGWWFGNWGLPCSWLTSECLCLSLAGLGSPSQAVFHRHPLIRPGEPGTASFCPTASEVEEERKTWQRRLAASRQETLDALRRLAEAEAGAEELSLLRSGLETAEAEREDAQDALRSCTPRPPPLLFQSRDDAEQGDCWSGLCPTVS